MPALALLTSAILWIALDQLTKIIVLYLLGPGQGVSFGMITIRKVLNRRASGRFLQSDAALVPLWIAEVVLLATVVQFGPFFQGAAAPIGLGTALGGAGSNLIDRLCRHGVVDFIDLTFWPVFNLADVGIVMGALIGILYI